MELIETGWVLIVNGYVLDFATVRRELLSRHLKLFWSEWTDELQTKALRDRLWKQSKTIYAAKPQPKSY
ncbi:hypothetical protein LCGC14_2988580 [marine sediment metagenome]|uniref:Uncharacterized protein n=1 Tax=marine sediment metagenome TaxID=412755 RepID=A0A0F8ZC05_9ZZZZ